MITLTDKNQPVPHEEYDEKYFLTDCGGYSNFIKYSGLRIDERLSKSLKLADVEPDMYVLDVGSGRGEIVLQCALRKAIAFGIDYSSDAIKLANELKIKYATIGNKMSFLRAISMKLPFKNHIFDRIFLLDLVEHLHDYELDDMFQGLNNILKENGIIIVHTAPNKSYYEYGYKIIRVVLYLVKGIKIDKNIRSNYEKNMHVNEQTVRSLSKLLDKNGFDYKVRLYDSSHPVSLIKEKIPNHPLSRIFLSIINWSPLRELFCKDIYAVAWKNSNNRSPGYVENVFDYFENIRETEYTPSSKDYIIEDIVSDCIVMGKNEIGVIGKGWYPLEIWPPAIRWTGKKAHAYLKVEEVSSKLFIKAITNYSEINVNILINKKFSKKFSLEDTNWKVLDINLPEYESNIIELMVEVDKTWIPDKIFNNNDIRELGIAIEKIWIG